MKMVQEGHKNTKRLDLRNDIIVKGLLRNVWKGIREEFHKALIKILRNYGIQVVTFQEAQDQINKIGKERINEFYIIASQEMYKNIFKTFKPFYPCQNQPPQEVYDFYFLSTCNIKNNYPKQTNEFFKRPSCMISEAAKSFTQTKFKQVSSNIIW